jgi:hypothetical protein
VQELQHGKVHKLKAFQNEQGLYLVDDVAVIDL